MSLALLATYGTLMRPFGRLEKLGLEEGMTFRCRCRFKGRMYDFGTFPGAVPGPDLLRGELFRLESSSAWRILDEYEGYLPEQEDASLFVRRKISLHHPSREAWVYWYNGDPTDQPRVRSGDWATYTQEATGAIGD